MREILTAGASPITVMLQQSDGNEFVPLTASQVLSTFRENGVSIAEWSVRHGYSPTLVYAVLQNKRKCLRGQSHKIAVALKLKPPPSMPLP